ncbi:MAG: phage tail family protein [Actinomycetia bacterium]|nr:phage tail family protein [Actinomycetes bacterium]
MATWYTSGSNVWSYRYKFTADHTKVGADVSDFPSCVKITTTEWPALANAITNYSVKVTDAGSESATHPDQISCAVRSGTKVFFVWQGANGYLYAKTFDTVSHALSDQFTLATDLSDTHYFPNIAIDSSGYLYVVWGYNGAISIRKSTNVNSTAAWGDAETVTSTTSAYPKLLIDQADTLHLTYRQVTEVPSPKQGYKRKTSGGSWSAEVELIDFSSLSDSVYVTCFALGREATGQKSLHIVGCHWDYTGSLDYDVFYMKSTDGGDTWTEADETEYSLPATDATLEKVYTGTVSRSMRVIAGTDGNAHISYAYSGGGTHHAGWDGDSWADTQVFSVAECSAIQEIGSMLCIIVGSRTDALYAALSSDDGATWSNVKAETYLNATYPQFAPTYSANDAVWMFNVSNGSNYDCYLAHGVPGGQGGDLVFTNDDGTTKIPHEIESFDGTTLVAWVKCTHDVDADKDFYVYCGCQTCANQEDTANAWDSNFVSVYHMTDESANLIDSLEAHTLAKVAQTEPAVTTSGKIASGQTFDGTNDKATAAITGHFDGSFTAEMWYRPSELRAACLVGSHVVSINDSYFQVYEEYQASPAINRLRFWVYDGTYIPVIRSGDSSIAVDTWYHIVAVRNTSDDKIYLYIDGSSVASGVTDTTTSTPSYSEMCLGAYHTSGTTYGQFAKGILDEVRFSSSARSATWITTSYNNQNKPLVGESGGFWKTGAASQQEAGAAAVTAAASIAAKSTQVVPGAAAISASASLADVAWAVRLALGAIGATATVSANGGMLAKGAAAINAVAEISADGKGTLAAAVAAVVAAEVALDGDAVLSGKVAAIISAVLEILASETNLVRAWCDLGITASATADGHTIASGAADIDAAASVAALQSLILGGVMAASATASVSPEALRVRPGASAIEIIAYLQALVFIAEEVLAEVSIDASASLGLAAGVARNGIAALLASAELALDGDAVLSGKVSADVIAALEILAGEINLVRAWCNLGITASAAIAGGRVTQGAAEIEAGATVGALSVRVILAAALLEAAASLTTSGGNVASGKADATVAAALAIVAASLRPGAVDVQAVVSLALDTYLNGVTEAWAAITAAASVSGASTVVCDGASQITVTGALALLAWRLAAGGSIAFTGSFANGSVIVIDTDAKTITVDGTNALHQMSGTFFKLAPGSNDIVYEDNGVARTVAAKVEHKDRWA